MILFVNWGINNKQIKSNLLQYHVSDDYKKHVSSSCTISNTFGIHNHLSHAKNNCNSDIKCIGILEQTCDNDGPFLLCKKGFETSKTHNSSCFYEKKEYSGM